MSFIFQSHTECMRLHDPMQQGKLIDREIEVRVDPLTGQTSRIVYDPGAPFIPPKLEHYEQMTAGGFCPFCEQNIWTSTPKYPAELVSEGRIQRGEAVVFPNLFPYSKHNAVVRMTKQHAVSLFSFNETLLKQAYEAAFEYVKLIAETDPATKYISINCNYLPPSGGSILHPHLQVLGSEEPSAYQREQQHACEQYYDIEEMSYYQSLIHKEASLGERWIGKKGDLHWVHAYAPRSHVDLIGVFDQVYSMHDLKAQHWDDLANSLMSVFAFMQSMGMASYNLVLSIPLRQQKVENVHVRIIPRLTIGQLGTSDMNVLNYMHGDGLSIKKPEDMAKRASTYFNLGHGNM